MLLLPSYRSTDFEVHRNWLAITHSLPLSKWYYEDRSEWTLDYPPFFAWFEWILSLAASRIDPEMTKVDNIGYASAEAVIFQRLTVIVSEVLLAYAAYRISRQLKNQTQQIVAFGILFLNPGILMVDNIHFQYNGALYGILLLSMTFLMEGKILIGGSLFAAVLNLKHIYLYQAPAIFFYILSSYCFPSNQGFSLINLIKIGVVTLSVFALSFAPFASHLPQVLSRLFPFKRGLCHAYWAPNFWTLYSFADRVAITLMKLAQVDLSSYNTDSMTRGLVGTSSFVVLPDVLPVHTLILTVISQLPVWWNIWRRPTPHKFVEAVVLCGFSSFLFGWHVHEKAILMVLVPLSVLAVSSRVHARFFYLLSCIGYFSLFPLLFAPTETPTKVIVLALYAIVSRHFLAYITVATGRDKKRRTIKATGAVTSTESPPTLGLSTIESLYLLGAIPVYVYAEFIHLLLFKDREGLEFLPLMLVSVYCAAGISYI